MQALEATIFWVFFTLLQLATPRFSVVAHQFPDIEARDAVVERDECNGVNASPPILNITYDQSECSPINSLNADGSCYSNLINASFNPTNCTFFCQANTLFYPMLEVPLPYTYCRGPNRCWIPQDDPSKAWTLQANFEFTGPPNERAALEQGISSGFLGEIVTVTPPVGDVTIFDGECGYFSWIGIKKSVCGSMTSPVVATPQLAEDCGCNPCEGNTTTDANFCIEDLLYEPEDNPADNGSSVFVYLDCETRLPLDISEQDYRFLYPGVQLDIGDLDHTLQSWVYSTCEQEDHFIYSAFTIKGRGFRDSLLGAWGSGLLAQLQTCGDDDPTQWKFEYTPTNGTFDWVASGIVSQFSYNCPANALMNIGARDTGHCWTNIDNPFKAEDPRLHGANTNTTSSVRYNH